MKKIILTALTVLMIFGLIGCSGVLHDKAALDISGFAVVGPNGSWDGSQKLTKVSDNEFTFEFAAKGETEQVSLQLVPGSWDTRYCGDLGGGKQAEVVADKNDETGSATMVYYEGGDPKHMLMKGLKAGGKYKITFKVNEANDIVVSVASVYVPTLYVLDTTKGAVKMDFDGTQYMYRATADGDTINLPVWTLEKYLKGTFALGATKPSDLTIEDTVATVDITGVVDGKDYNVYITYDGKKATVKAESALPKVYIAGESPFNWELDKGNAVQANIVGATSWYYYTFEAKTATLNFKVVLKEAWSDAYSNNTEESLPNKTTVDAAPVEFSNANAQNAQITGLTVGKKYTLLINIASGKPAVSVITGEDILFAIGNDDFGGWNWDSCKTMTPAGAGEWKYEFKATKADAEFKFQTKCGGWVDAAQLGAAATLSLGGEYIDLVNKGGSTPGIKATLTVGSDYVLSVKKSGDKYQVKIAEKQ